MLRASGGAQAGNKNPGGMVTAERLTQPWSRVLGCGAQPGSPANEAGAGPSAGGGAGGGGPAHVTAQVSEASGPGCVWAGAELGAELGVPVWTSPRSWAVGSHPARECLKET